MPDSHNLMAGLGRAFNHIDPEHVTNGQLYSLLYSMHAQQLDAAREMAELRKELAEQKKAMKSITDAWQTSQGMLSFLKMLASIGLPVGIVYGLIKTGVLEIFRGV